MINIHITKNEMPSLEQFDMMLDAAENKLSDVDILAKLMRDLALFERQYDMTSDRFHTRFMDGEIGDKMPFIEWAGKYENHQKLKQRIEQRLQKLDTLEQQLDKLFTISHEYQAVL